MEVAFNVAWGPLSQIAIPLIDVNAAIQLAVGAYGWWKARERSVSLIELVNGNGGRLSASLSFNISQYLMACQSSEFRGIAWFDGRLESVPVPNASTAKFGDAGMICLRAITTALLTFYNIDSTTAVLAHIIPHCLINYDLERDPVVVDGPFLTTVRQFVSGIAAEEHCNTVRKRIQERVDVEYRKLFSTPIMTGVYVTDVKEAEIPIIIGLFKWVLAPPSKRDTNLYPTRSLSAWCMTVFLSQLGFDVRHSSVLISTTALYDEHLAPHNHPAPSSVFLVACDGRRTDFLMPTPGAKPTKSSQSPRIVPIKSIPSVIFRHLRHESKSIIVERLCEIWDEAFEHASSSISPVQVRNIDNVSESAIESTIMEPLVHTEIGVCVGTDADDDGDVANSPPAAFGLLKVLEPLLRKHIPNHKWTPNLLYEILDAWIEEPEIIVPQKNSPKGDNWYIFTSIILATVYAICSKSLLSEEKHSGSEFIDVSIYPDLVSAGTIKTKLWREMFIDVCDALDRRGKPPGLSLERWTRLQFNICTGELVNEVSFMRDGTLGYHANGIFVVSNMLLHPQLRPQSLAEFHIVFGQPLQIPVTDHGFVVAMVEQPPRPVKPVPIPASDLPISSTLKSNPSDQRIRIDLEPFWESNPRHAVYRVRIGGVLICSFNPMNLIIDLADACLNSKAIHMVSCSCGSKFKEVSVPSEERWKTLEFSQFLARGESAPGHFGEESCLHAGMLEDGEYDHLLIPTARDTAAQVFVCVYCWTVPKIVALDCIKCAYTYWHEKIRRNIKWKRSYERGAILIDGLV